MEDGGVDRLDTSIIDNQQHKMGQMADFPPLLQFFTYKDMMYLKLNLRPCGIH